MVVRADVQEGFSGIREWPAVGPAFREKCIAVIESVAPESVLHIQEFRGELTLVVRRAQIREICRRLRDDADLKFDYLSDVTALDYLNMGREPRFEVVYHLYSIVRRHRLRLRAPVEESDCRIDSVVEVWPGADWNERETYDFFGIEFTGHPDLRRILMPDDWEGWPLRKDFPLGGTKSFYFKKSTSPYAGEPDDLIPRIRKEVTDI